MKTFNEILHECKIKSFGEILREAKLLEYEVKKQQIINDSHQFFLEVSQENEVPKDFVQNVIDKIINTYNTIDFLDYNNEGLEVNLNYDRGGADSMTVACFASIVMGELGDIAKKIKKSPGRLTPYQVRFSRYFELGKAIPSKWQEQFRQN